MDKKIKAKWLKALRSGKYKQGKKVLKTKNGKFCCLGVLCDLYSKATKTPWVKNGSGLNYMHNYFGVLSDKVVAWSGLSDSSPHLLVGVRSKSLAELNDGTGYGFKKIANLIEKQL